MKVALYIRVSTADQTGENQARQLHEWADRNGHTIVATFTDEDVSGSKSLPQRPAGRALLAGVAARQYDIVATWSVDRLGRSLIDLVRSLMTLHENGVQLFLHQQNIDTSTPAGRAMFQMLGVFAEFELAMLKDRTRAGMARARAQGKQIGRQPVSQEKIDAIRRYRREGHGIQKTARLAGVGVSVVQRVDKS